MKTDSNSSANIPALQKFNELNSLLLMYLRRSHKPPSMSYIFNQVEHYNQLLLQYSHQSIEKAKVFEIGFGARPNRLIALTSIGIDAYGVDLDMPLLRGTLREFIEIYKKNGTERFLKSLVRFILFDQGERRSLAQEIKNHGYELEIHENRFIVDDAANVEIQPQSLDLIFSEDVFEHISLSSLEKLIPKMAKWLKPDGLALIRPNIFTGILGGHLAEWFAHTLKNRSMPRKSEPWEHLRKKRYQANTYLNQLSRADYRNLFSSSFEILEERVKNPNLGKEYLSPEVLEELKGYTDEELFSNQVLFVLKPKTVL